MKTNTAILGAGAVGSSIGADLTRAGHDVLLIDQWPAHVEAMKADGLHITMSGQELHTPVQAFHLCELCVVRPQLDIVFLAAKSYDTCWMVEFIKPYLKPDGIVVCVQNSLNEEWVAPIVGWERDVTCSVQISAELFEPGRVKRNTDHAHTRFVLGELNGRITPRLQKVAQMLSEAGKTEISTNIWGVKWSKLVFSSMILPVDAMTGVSTWEASEDRRLLGFLIKQGKEGMEVGTALGYTLEPFVGLTADEFVGSAEEVLERSLLKLRTGVPKELRSCILQDILKGRRTEVEYLSGLLAKKGRDVKVRTPLNEAVTSVVKQIEQGKLKPSLSNLKILEQYEKSGETVS